jgi:hypothetical protein
MTVIPGIPRAPKGQYRPAPTTFEGRPDNEVLVQDAALSSDPYLHPSYAKAFRRPASPIEEGRFDPRVHSTSVRRSRSMSRQNTSSSAHSRSRSVPFAPPPVQQAVSQGHKRHGSSGSATSPPSSKGSSPSLPSRRGSPAHSSASSVPPTVPPSPNTAPGFAPVIPFLPPPPTQPPVQAHDEAEADAVAAILHGSTRPGKLTKRRRSDKTVASSKAESHDTVRTPPPLNTSPAKPRSAFSRFRFGRAAAGRVPAEPVPDAILPPERRPSERDFGEPSGRFLSPASSFVILDGPPSPPPDPVGVMNANFDYNVGSTVVEPSLSRYPAASIYSTDTGHHSQAAPPRGSPAKADLDKVDELDETDPSGFAWHTSGPYDAIGSVVGSQRGSQIMGSQVSAASPAAMRNPRSQV